jgi:acetophenone carboxylase
VIKAAVDSVADTVRLSLNEARLDGDNAELFCFGGNGGNFAAAVAQEVGLGRAYAFALGPVFSAFGSSVSDVCHVHEEWPERQTSELAPQDTEMYLARGQAAVEAELEGEGMLLDSASWDCEVTFEAGTETVVWRGPADPSVVHREIAGQPRNALLRRLAVRGILPVPSPQLGLVPSQSYEATPVALRPTVHGDVQIYDWATLSPGASLVGPAMIEADANSCAVPTGWVATIDGYRNAVITKGGPGA